LRIWNGSDAQRRLSVPYVGSSDFEKVQKENEATKSLIKLAEKKRVRI